MDIAEVAKSSGVPASTLRFYEEKGLIRSVGRQGLRRVFGPDVIERLALIALGRSAGFSLDEIAVMYLGKIVEVANSDTIYRDPRHAYTKALLSAIPSPDPKARREKILLEGGGTRRPDRPLHRHARRVAPRRGLPGEEPHGVPLVQAAAAGRVYRPLRTEGADRHAPPQEDGHPQDEGGDIMKTIGLIGGMSWE